MSRHTPGPWGLVEHQNTVSVVSVRAKLRDGETIAYVARDEWVKGDDRARIDANAALIAAAPELLAALRTTLGNLRDLKHNAFRNLDTIDEWISAVEAAIAKAEGRS